MKHLNTNLIQKTLSGLFLADPEKWVHFVGPGVHLVGTLNILTSHAQGWVASAKCHMYMCTYMKGNYNPYRSCWEIFSLACTIGHLLYFVRKIKLKTHSFQRDETSSTMMSISTKWNSLFTLTSFVLILNFVLVCPAELKLQDQSPRFVFN